MPRPSTTSDLLQSAIHADPAHELRVRGLFPESPAVPLRHGLSFGRSEECGVVLSGRGASRIHAQVQRQGPLLFILKDLDSRNGSYVDGRRVREAAIGPGSLLRFGQWLGCVEVANESPQRPAPPTEELCDSPCLWRSLEAARKVAPTDLPIVLIGESGTGKEVVARSIHAWSRRPGPFRAVNCGSIPKDLAEGELFGYRRGAFSGAERASPGYFRAAHQGTLLLDEIADLPAAIQTSLLRVLQERTVTPLGETEPQPADARIIVAGQRSLQNAVDAGTFRQDLWMRLRGLEVELPPLRQRPQDTVQLLGRFLRKYTPRGQAVPQADCEFTERLCLHSWPGNVRELEMLVRKLLALHADAPLLKARHLPVELQATLDPSDAGANRDADDGQRLAAELRRNGLNLAAACRTVKISRQRAYRLFGGQSPEGWLESLGMLPEPSPKEAER